MPSQKNAWNTVAANIIFGFFRNKVFIWQSITQKHHTGCPLEGLSLLRAWSYLGAGKPVRRVSCVRLITVITAQDPLLCSLVLFPHHQDIVTHTLKDHQAHPKAKFRGVTPSWCCRASPETVHPSMCESSASIQHAGFWLWDGPTAEEEEEHGREWHWGLLGPSVVPEAHPRGYHQQD